MTTSPVYEFAVIGAGVVGSAIARELAGITPSVVLVEARSDVGDGVSKANTAILHTGFDATPGSLESRLVARGYHLTLEYSRAAHIGVDVTGAILVAWDDEQADSLPGLQAKAVDNGYQLTELMDPEEVYRELPHLGPGVTGGLRVPDEAVIDAWTVPLALATDAVNRGTVLRRDTTVDAVTIGAETTILHTTSGDIEARWVVNAAGPGGDIVDAMFGNKRLQIHPRRGELLVYDKLARPLAPKIVLAAPSKMGKGVLISPTIYGNVMLGPTADDIEDREATGTTEDGFEFLIEKGRKILPTLVDEEVTAAYAGLRAAHNLGDYLIEVDPPKRYVIAAGIRSTGLTSAMAVAEYVLQLLAESGYPVDTRPNLPDPPTMAPLGHNQIRPYQDDDLIHSDPEYGTMVCFCERVSRGELRDAMDSTIPPATIGGLRRRTRAMNGRCQGFYCGAEVLSIFEAERKESDE